MRKIRIFFTQSSASKIFLITIILGLLPILLSFAFKSPNSVIVLSYSFILIFILGWMNSALIGLYKMSRDKDIFHLKLVNISTAMLIIGLLLYTLIFKRDILMILINTGFILMTFVLSKELSIIEKSKNKDTSGIW